MLDLVGRWLEIHQALEGKGLTDAQREDATSAILQAENPAVTITVNDGGGSSAEKLYTVEGREGAGGAVKFTLDSLRWELGPGGAHWPDWDTAWEGEVIAKFEELSGLKVSEVTG